MPNNRSMLFAASAIPDGTEKQDLKTIGLSEYSCDVPAIYKLLVSSSPKPCRTCVFEEKPYNPVTCEYEDRDCFTIAGDAKEGLSILKKLREELSETSASLPAIEEAIAFLSQLHNQYPYYLLELTEVFALSREPSPLQFKSLLKEISTFDLEGLKARGVEESRPQDWASRSWRNALYYTPKSIVEPPVKAEYVEKEFLSLSAKELLAFTEDDLLVLADNLTPATNHRSLTLNMYGKSDSLTACLERLRAVPHPFCLSFRGLVGELPNTFPMLPMVSRLNLSNLQLGDLPSSLANLSGLSRLQLSMNCFTELPEVLRQMKTLEHIELTDTPIGVIPAWIGELSDLKVLRLANCRMTNLPEEIWTLTKLEELNISNNLIGSLSSSIGQLHELNTFWMAGIGAKKLPDELWTLTKLDTLSIAKNIYDVPIPSHISQLVKLYNLYISGCGLEIFPTEVCNLPSLKRVDASDNYFTTMPDCIRAMPLECITLRNTPLRLPLEFQSKLVEGLCD